MLAVAIAPTTILMSLGIGVLLCSALATGAAVVVLPAALVLLGPRIEAFALPRAASADAGLGLGRRPRSLGHALAGRRGRRRHGGAARAGDPGRGPRDRAAGHHHAARRPPSHARTSSASPPSWDRAGRRRTTSWSPRRSARSPIRELLVEIKSFQRRIAADPRVDSVVGPGAFVSTSRDLEALPRGLRDSAKLLNGGKRDLGRLERGLGQAGAGAQQLRSGLGSAAEGAGKLKAGAGTGGSGAGRLRAGIVQARDGAAKISGGLGDALAGANALKRGAAQALTGSEKLSGGLGQAVTPVREGLPVFQSLATDVASSASAVSAAHGSAQAVTGQVGAALAALQSMTAGKQDPGYAAARRGPEHGAGGAAA